MPDPLEALILDLVASVARPRPHAEVMEAWRTSCPRLTVWEDALERGWVVCRPAGGGEVVVETTAAGHAALAAAGRVIAATPR